MCVRCSFFVRVFAFFFLPSCDSNDTWAELMWTTFDEVYEEDELYYVDFVYAQKTSFDFPEI